MRLAKFQEPFLFGALIGESLFSAPALRIFLADQPREWTEIGMTLRERLEFLQADVAIIEQGERGLVGNRLRPEPVAEITNRLDGSGLAFGCLQHGGITQPWIERFEI